jgi:hypothetical protein
LNPRPMEAAQVFPDRDDEVTDEIRAVLSSVPAWWAARAQRAGLPPAWRDWTTTFRTTKFAPSGYVWTSSGPNCTGVGTQRLDCLHIGTQTLTPPA